MSTAESYFNFGASSETMSACLSLLERGLRGDVRISKQNRLRVYTGNNRERMNATNAGYRERVKSYKA